jgi:hypothetical protein
MWDDYFDLIKSDVADLKNTGGRAGGTITAGAFLSKFAKNYPWTHLDIAGTAWNDKGGGYVPKGATGIGVRLLVELATEYASEAASAPKPAALKAAVKAPAKMAKAPAAKAPAKKVAKK